ncbi:Poly(U)-specific endoribonuclease -like protein [Trichinella patagoniensis]|uniref:Poly(U)-specific endoribonuclease-like protein n=2 Tax=Trichinella patagoniensis TaxID=990121 RepID=A0A0V1AAX1_9BILA|nr:Poly(U)-specific endoribonuclease -like protein [Trichinella patagoniensis]
MYCGNYERDEQENDTMCYYLLALSLMSIFVQWKKGKIRRIFYIRHTVFKCHSKMLIKKSFWFFVFTSIIVLSTFALTLRPSERKEQPEDDGYDKQDTAILKFQKTINDEEIKILVNRMREADENRAKDDDYKLNYQQRTTPHEEEDLAPLPLFTWVNEQLLNRSTYRAYLDLVPLFHPEVSIDEDWNAEEKKKIYAFLDEIMHTKVFNLMWEFLLEKKLVPDDKFQFKNLLFTQWFGLYTRSHGHLGSSGFEHVFIGEWRKHIVEGQHYWLRFYSLEKQGHINYKGWLLHDKNVAATIHYDWRSHHKEIGGFLIGSSPEFDFSLFTLCFNAKRGQNACKVLIDEFPIHVTSFRVEHKPFIGTSYPVLI